MALLFLEFIGTTEMLVIMIAALVLFGPRKLPELGRSLGKHLGEFKRASEDFKRTWESEVDMERLDRDVRTEQAALPGDTTAVNSTDTPQLSASETSIARSSDEYDQSYGSDSSSSSNYDGSYPDGNYYGDSSSTGYTSESTDSNSDTTAVITTATDGKEVDGDATVATASSQAAPDADETVMAPAASSKDRT